jgi:hypothetical protein
MHTLLIVTVSMSYDATSEDARGHVHDLLCEDDSFCGNGGRFGSPLCDWFLVGGRWSGLLQETLFGDAYQAAFKREFPHFADDWYPRDLVEQHREALTRFWHRFGGQGEHPVTRHAWDITGGDDDAMPLNRRLYDHFLKEHAGFATSLPGQGAVCDFADLDDEPVEESFIDRKWLVVIDYHS